MDTLFTKFLKRLLKYGLEWFNLYYSEYDGVCVDNEDPSEQGRILVRVPNVGGNKPLGKWAWPKPVWGGRNCGQFVVPDVNDPVLVTFMNGNPSFPRYSGGAWPNPKGVDNFTPTGMYVDGKPVIRAFRTKAGHELSFSDDPDNLGIKLIWHKVVNDEDLYTFIAFTNDGNIQIANHKGAVFEMRALDDDGDLNMLLDSRGNSFIQDKDGMKMADANGNVVDLRAGAVQITGTDDVILASGKTVSLSTGSVVLGKDSAEDSVRGTAWFNWFTNTFLNHYIAHIHSTGVGPTSALCPPPLVPPIEQDVLTKNVKVP